MCGAWLLAGWLFLRQADAPRCEDLRHAVGALVQQLNDSQLAKRAEAETALIRLGPDVLDVLPRVDDRTPAEAKVRLGRVVLALEKALAEQAARAALVTWKGEAPLSEALEALRKQTGNRVVGVEGRGSVLVKAAFEETPYWEALDRLLDQAGLTVDPEGGAAGQLRVAARPRGQLPRFGQAAYSGLFRIEAARVEAVRDLRNPQLEGLKIRLEISWEPRVTPIALAQPLAQLHVLDDRGRQLRVDDPARVCSVLTRRQVSSAVIDAPLQLPDRDVRRIASFKGSLAALLPGRVERFVFSNLEAAAEAQQRKAGVAVTLEHFSKKADVYEGRIRVLFEKAATAFESYRGWIYENKAYLIDRRGRRVESRGAAPTLQGAREAGFAYQFALDNGPAGCQFVYETPALIVESQVAYELKNIELP